MIDFRTISIEMNAPLDSRNERYLEIPREGLTVPFSKTGTLIGDARLTFDSAINRFEGAIKSFHFETKNDHNIGRLKLEPIIERLSANNELRVTVRAAFRDNSPEDDFKRGEFIMTATILVIVDRA